MDRETARPAAAGTSGRGIGRDLPREAGFMQFQATRPEPDLMGAPNFACFSETPTDREVMGVPTHAQRRQQTFFYEIQSKTSMLHHEPNG